MPDEPPDRSNVRPPHISRWDLDKTYLRTEFDTMRDLVRTALERADEKRTNPGAATLLRELAEAKVSIHILSGSPEQMRRRLEEKLKLDGIAWDDFTLKPNLKNMLRLRFRALRDQLGYKLPALLASRTEAGDALSGVRETLFGDDAEADAFVYSLYADIMAGRAGEELVHRILERGRVYEDVTEATVRCVRLVKPEPVVERIFIHLEQQTHPRDFQVFGARVVPFYNYLQTAYVIHEDGRLPAESLLRVAAEMVTLHRFDGDALARSYADVARRGHLQGTKLDALVAALPAFEATAPSPAKDEVRRMVELLPPQAELARAKWKPPEEEPMPDYIELVERHNPRHKKRKK
ncbi:MAG: hypothetical protein KIS78_15805 [Labilithrix sp.]|nr:hypothetical protein [Labilithrix sp.]MCW5833866.1 hypothetical protein [Labilithrix sp.]